MIKAAIYARYSTDHQREESITAQVRACTEYCKRKGYALVRTYADEARSATTDDRPQFQEAIRDAKAGLFNILVVHKLDRFARNRYDSAFYKRELRRAGVKLESVLEPLDDSPESVLMESLLEGLAEYYSRNLGRESMKGMRETALQAKHNGGRPPLGYDIDDDGHYVVNEHEARAVRLIFELYDRGFGYGKIINELHSLGYRTKRGGHFGKNSLHEILKNEKYMGVYVFNKVRERIPGLPRSNRRLKPPEEVIRIPGAVPAIVSEDVFRRVQDKMDKRRQKTERARQKAKKTYLLSGLVYCGDCGAAYIGNISTARGKEYCYYECGARERTRTCQNRRIKKNELENLVLNELEKSIFAPAIRKELVDRLIVYHAGTAKESLKEREYLLRERARLDNAINNLLMAIEQGNAPGPLLDKLSAREREKVAIDAELDRLSAKMKITFSRKDIERYLDEIYSQFKKRNNEEQLKPLVQQFVKKVVVFEKQIEVELVVVLVANGVGGPTYSITKTISSFSDRLYSKPE